MQNYIWSPPKGLECAIKVVAAIGDEEAEATNARRGAPPIAAGDRTVLQLDVGAFSTHPTHGFAPTPPSRKHAKQISAHGILVSNDWPNSPQPRICAPTDWWSQRLMNIAVFGTGDVGRVNGTYLAMRAIGWAASISMRKRSRR